MGSRALVARRRADGFALSVGQWGASGAGVPAVVTPLESGLSWSDVLSRVDFVLHEELWVVDRETRVYVPCALALDPTRADAGDRGLLVRSRDDRAAVRAFFEGAREALAGAVREGSLTEASALARLASLLTDRFGDREVVRVP